LEAISFVMMQKILNLLTICILIISGSADAQVLRPKALFSHANFMMAGKSPYVESYLLVKGNSVKYAPNANGKFQASIEVILSVSEGDKIKFADRYNLLSPETEDTAKVGFNFLDQQRIPLPNGNYTLSVSIKDNNNPMHEKVEASEPLLVRFPADSMSISDIELIQSATKNDKPGPLNKGGFTLVPHISDFYGQEEEKLIFYAEAYRALENLGENQKYLINYYLEDIAKGQKLDQFSGFSRFNTASVNSIMAELNIQELYSGNFNLVIEARNKENQLVAIKKTALYRYNPYQSVALDKVVTIVTEGSFAENYKNPDSLAEHIRCLSPISSMRERGYAENLVKDKNLKYMQQYFLGFWKNKNPQDPAKAWNDYFQEVRKVEATFATTIKRGYNSDRGRVYLQYGPPDNRQESLREPSAYPYEIWQYYRINNQSNRRFVFCNQDLVTNDFLLIHSDALGEHNNDQWMFIIMKRDTQTNDIDQTESDSHFGSQLKQNFQTPR
jgi:GWxTD domain-containing protein